MRLAGKRVLITGTGTVGGQGAAAQALFAREGARVVGCDVKDGAAEATAERLRADGLDVSGTTVDLTDPAAAEQWIEDGASTLGGIDVLYNNAARARFAPFADMTLELWRDVIQGELDVIFHTTSPAWRHLKHSGGASIISPGLVKTPSTDAFVGDELRSFQMNMHLIRRPGLGDDIAYLAVYLASDESSWVTGQNYSIDGGVTAGFR